MLLNKQRKKKKTYDAVFQLTIESPFRNKEHLDCAINVMNVFETDVVIGVREKTIISINIVVMVLNLLKNLPN